MHCIECEWHFESLDYLQCPTAYFKSRFFPKLEIFDLQDFNPSTNMSIKTQFLQIGEHKAVPKNGFYLNVIID